MFHLSIIKLSVVILTVFLLLAVPQCCSAFERTTSKKEVDLLIKAPEIDIGGTLLVPQTAKRDLLVIFTSGSSWQDRDSTLFDFPMFKVIAQHLAQAGIASFRYDDRGVGTSTGDFINSTLDDLSSDLDRIMTFFATNKAHHYRHFVLLGHSQGGIVVSKAAKNNQNVKAVVLAASPGVTISQLVLAQIRLEYSLNNHPVADVENVVSANNELLFAAYSHQNTDVAFLRLKETYAQLLKPSQLANTSNDSDLENRINNTANEMKINYGLPALTSFAYYDPLNDLTALRIPVLSLHGGNDRQVTIEPNKDRLETALLKSGSPYRIKVFEEANHFFQPSKTGLNNEYGTLEKHFVNGFLDEISSFILHL